MTVLYARAFSLRQQASLARQLSCLREFATARGLAVDETLTDVGSALYGERKYAARRLVK